MTSFFEKLKKGMEIEEPVKDEARQERPIEELKEEVEEKKPKKIKIEKKLTLPEIEKPEVKREEEIETKKEEWFKPEGQLAIDVYQTENDLVIQSAIAGIKPEDLDISIEGDVITIRGARERPFEEEGDYFSQECYWGPFSREVILAEEVDPSRVTAEMKEGILTIRIPKIQRQKKRKVAVKTKE